MNVQRRYSEHYICATVSSTRSERYLTLSQLSRSLPMPREFLHWKHLGAIGARTSRGFIPLLRSREDQHGDDEHAKTFEPKDQKGFRDHTPISASIRGATAPASR